MNTKTNYLSLDLELNTEDGNPKYIIEVGISIGNIESGIFFNKSWLVKPVFDLKGNLIPSHSLSDHIIQLTGITQDEYDKNSVTLSEVAKELEIWIKFYNTFVNPVTWGLGDAKELKTSFLYEGIHFPFFGRRIIDVKHFFLYIEAANGRSLAGGLRKSMAKHKMKFQGRPHRAEVDAENTLLFFFHLLRRQHKLETLINDAKQI